MRRSLALGAAWGIGFGFALSRGLEFIDWKAGGRKRPPMEARLVTVLGRKPR